MTEQQTYIQPDMEDEDEIDLLKLAKTFWSGRKTVFICLLIGAVLGVFVAVLTPAEYTATTIMVPQSTGKSSSMGSLGGLAALAGIDISGGAQGGDMSPILYPKIVSSIPFKMELMNTPIKFKEFEKPISLFEYSTNPIYSHSSFLGIIKKYTIGLPGVIIGAIKGKKVETSFSKDERGKLLVLTDDQSKISKALDNIVSLEVEPKQGYLTLNVVMPEALAAAQLAQKAQELLQRDITYFKVQKAKADLEFIQERYEEAKAEAEGYQINIAQRTDQYKNLTSVVPQVQTTRIQTKYGIASTVFQELAKQLEQAKIQVKKDTPVFTIVEPVSVPNEKSKPSRPLILIIWIFLGGIIGTGIVFGKGLLAGVKKKWVEEEE
jgi:LPS O-antigen subunit length determinant protein (WzzB/FepE family)